MESGGAPPASTSPTLTVQSSLCCMCGDRGLAPELFRCRFCLFRTQHKYCSDLYPKAESYRVCNWCLREEAAGTKPVFSNEPDRIGSASSSPVPHSSTGIMSRGEFCPHLLNKPVKKQRFLDDGSAAAGRRARQALRGKARRYKLLEEVSS